MLIELMIKLDIQDQILKTRVQLSASSSSSISSSGDDREEMAKTGEREGKEVGDGGRGSLNMFVHSVDTHHALEAANRYARVSRSH